MQKLIECVPNISEGRNQAVIDAVVRAASVEGVRILDVDRGAATNRTVITFVGDPESVLEGAFRLVEKAAELIDMSTHAGEHPRIGATDVLPFVPLQGVEMGECVELANKLAERVGRELKIPVYLYEYAATKEERRSLAYCREGEYEGLENKLKNPEMKPDFGEAKFNSRSGLTVIGARPFLIAYNINLNTRDKKLANWIAMRLRESGFKKKDSEGRFVRDKNGQPVIEPGLFKHCRAVGWYIDEYKRAQVSINFTNFEVTPIHTVFDAACKLAEEIGLRVTGSELVGLVPKRAVLMAGEHYLRKQKALSAVPEKQLIECALNSLGLSEIVEFKPKERILEEKISGPTKLLGLGLVEFVDLLSSDTPAPGGGSVSALGGALAGALCSMVAALTFGKAKAKELEKRKQMEQIAHEAQQLKAELLSLMEADTGAFDEVLAAFRVKAESVEEQTKRSSGIVAAYLKATEIPLSVMRTSLRAYELAFGLLTTGLQSALSDGAVACEFCRAAINGASYNVRINLKEIEQKYASTEEAQAFVRRAKQELAEMLEQSEVLTKQAQQRILAVL